MSMVYYISIRHRGNQEGATFDLTYETFDDAWAAARQLVEATIDEFHPVEVAFRKKDKTHGT